MPTNLKTILFKHLFVMWGKSNFRERHPEVSFHVFHISKSHLEMGKKLFTGWREGVYMRRKKSFQTYLQPFAGTRVKFHEKPDQILLKTLHLPS